MKTIEKRADDYVGHPLEIDEFSSASIKRQAFIDGAKEQKKIDIDKACEWLEAYIACGVSPEGTYAFIARFRKAMEE